MLRAKADNSAANKAESEREPIQTSVYQRKKRKTTEKKKGKKPKGSNSSQQQLRQTIEQQTIIETIYSGLAQSVLSSKINPCQ